jgi:hypothetical protein
VESRDYIRVNHKNLLEDWRESVVRKGGTTYIAANKKRYVMSLNRTCMNCHKDKAEFCDQCHNYMGVTNKCWDCHMYPKELQKELVEESFPLPPEAVSQVHSWFDPSINSGFTTNGQRPVEDR